MNLFGVDMDAEAVMDRVTKSNKEASKAEIQKVLNDLIQMVTEVDPSGTSQDFSRRKSFHFYDPYNPDS